MYKKDIGFLFAILKMCDDIESYKKDYNNIRNILNERIGLNACLMNITQIGEYSIEKIEKILENQIPELIKNILKIIDELVNSSRISKQLIEASSKDFKTITLDNFFA
jgi:uncharacterized protein with HEPN domain